jgi:hypothetical protein|eukprot:CAMPEP_0168315484 /NCGR_PEP_ID=MMETSP0210-20121227/11372_1 /TAXON_ID=40633 /ORGANISM="Condylostoma magnum, Strain COL2" /LENGTH=51 /DNA_ID=CAMNT_0008288857 /DNA_START=269 /DNA_END=427 /DNA_ORIENTATION=-
MGNYNVISHNCNNFTDEAMKFLVDKNIPTFITGLPAEIMNTPIGTAFAPMI